MANVRVRFGEHSSSERRALAELDVRIDRFLAELAQHPRGFAAVGRAAERVFPGLDAEFLSEGWLVRGKLRRLAPIANRIRERAVSRLRVLSERPALPFEQAVSRARPHIAFVEKSQVRAGFSRGHLIELVVTVPGGTGSDVEKGVVERLVRDLLGDRIADDWIGAVQVVPAPAPRRGGLRVLAGARAEAESRLGLRELPESIAAAIRGLYLELPQQPYFATEIAADWTLFELDPDPDDDLAEQNDLVLASTCVPELLKSYLEGAPFSSSRFSRHGELFAHLKYQAEGSPEARLARRLELEDRLDGALLRARVGRVIGAGLGLRHAYVNFALGEPEAAMAIICEVGRHAKLPRAAWVQPFDTDLSQEWAEVWPGAPAPPGVGPQVPSG